MRSPTIAQWVFAPPFPICCPTVAVSSMISKGGHTGVDGRICGEDDDDEGHFDAMVAEDQEFHDEGTSLAEADAVAPGELSSPVLVGQEVGEESREACAVLEAAAPRVISRLEAVRMRVAARLAKS